MSILNACVTLVNASLVPPPPITVNSYAAKTGTAMKKTTFLVLRSVRILVNVQTTNTLALIRMYAMLHVRCVYKDVLVDLTLKNRCN